MDKIGQDETRSNNHQEKPSSKRNHIIGRNQNESDERIRGSKGIRKERRTSIERQQNSLYSRKNLCSKQQKNTRASFVRKS